ILMFCAFVGCFIWTSAILRAKSKLSDAFLLLPPNDITPVTSSLIRRARDGLDTIDIPFGKIVFVGAALSAYLSVLCLIPTIRAAVEPPAQTHQANGDQRK